ncbi:MAG: 3'-5' exonuclease [Lachnospiraceae bacterium]|nr:3'-5' exonuclease [Lachnospiraceae bacterium]
MNDYTDELLSDLNEAQLEAASTTEGYVRVIAGAGSGKTRALTHRFAYLVNELGILPGHILCVTFTNKSANEMRQRIHLLTGDNDTGYISTFHGFCVNILQEDSHAVQYPKSFLVLDNSDINDMLKIIYEERGLSLRDMTFSKARDMIEIRKLKTDPEYYRDMIHMDLSVLREKYLQAEEPMDIIFYGYLYQEKKAFALDYNDLIKFSLYIFETNEEIRLKWQKRLEYIMIDEFQDIDPLQVELMEVLSAYHKNLFVVGDPDQTIYTWRGANVKYLMEFDQVFSGTKTILMMQNYRSTPQILAAVNSLIDKNEYRIKKDLLPVLPDGEKPLCHHGKNTAEEAEWIGKKILELNKELAVPLKDITVLYRAHYVTRPLEEVFMKEKIPYTIYSGVQFFERMEIKDALSYLRMAAFQDDLSFRRVVNTPKRNIGRRRMSFLEEYAESHGISLYTALQQNLEEEFFRGTGAAEFTELIDHFTSISGSFPITDLLSMILNASGYEKALRTEGSQERLDNLAELKQSIYEYEISCGEEAGLADYLRHVALYTNQDAQQPGDKVKLMTVHASKGLEFPNVFLCGLNEGVFPSGKVKDQKGMEEERRLAFVALTRAEQRLFLTEAMGRNFDGSPRYPSRFLLDIEEHLLDHTEPLDERLIRETRSYIRIQKNSSIPSEEQFAAGQRVRHKVFGEGKILKADPESQAYTILFDKLGTEREVSFRAKLEKL